MLITQVAAHGTRFDYFAPWNENQTDYVKLGEDNVIAVVLDDDCELIEWITDDSTQEFVVNIATQGKWLIVLDTAYKSDNIQAAINERDLYADCFNAEHVKPYN